MQSRHALTALFILIKDNLSDSLKLQALHMERKNKIGVINNLLQPIFFNTIKIFIKKAISLFLY